MGRSGKKLFNFAGLFARWSFIIAINLALLLVVGVSTVRETYRDWQVNHEIQDLQTQVQGLEGKKTQISDLIQKLNSSDVLDKEARARLGMQKPGEKVAILHGSEIDINQPQEAIHAPVASLASNERSNPQKWFNYFFTR